MRYEIPISGIPPIPDLQSSNRNRLLGALPPSVYERLSSDLHPVGLLLGDVLHEAGGPIEYAYFPADCIVSMTYELADGDMGEQAIIGNEGMVGTGLFMGAGSMPSRAIVQTHGSAYRLPGNILVREFDRHGLLYDLLLRYVQSLFTQVAQTAVCNRHHTVEQQLCRWILLSIDRLAGDSLTMTQQFIADMLGVRREGVTLCAGRLQKEGTISYRRGQITVVDRARLEQLCCECYEVVRTEYERLLGAP